VQGSERSPAFSLAPCLVLDTSYTINLGRRARSGVATPSPACALSGVYDLPAWITPRMRAVPRIGTSPPSTTGPTDSPLEKKKNHISGSCGHPPNSATVLGKTSIRSNASPDARLWPGTRPLIAGSKPALRRASRLHLRNVGRKSATAPVGKRSTGKRPHFNSLNERASFQFAANSQLTLNHTNLGLYRFVHTPQFGTITQSTTPGRKSQLSARYRSKPKGL